MSDFAEKRSFLRMPMDCELNFSTVDGGETYHGKVVNLSNRGILFTAERSFNVGARLEIVLTPANSVTPPMQARVTVTRVEAVEGSQQIACRIDDDES